MRRILTREPPDVKDAAQVSFPNRFAVGSLSVQGRGKGRIDQLHDLVDVSLPTGRATAIGI
jgi:hypothetical protein